MADIRLFRQAMIRVLMAGRNGRLNLLSSLIGNLATEDGFSFLTWTKHSSSDEHRLRGVYCQYTAVIWFIVI